MGAMTPRFMQRAATIFMVRSSLDPQILAGNAAVVNTPEDSIAGCSGGHLLTLITTLGVWSCSMGLSRPVNKVRRVRKRVCYIVEKGIRRWKGWSYKWQNGGGADKRTDATAADARIYGFYFSKPSRYFIRVVQLLNCPKLLGLLNIYKSSLALVS